MRRRRAFTLVELLIVILVMAILMAVAMPLYLAAVAQSERSCCRANMQTLATAEQSYRTRNPNFHNYTTTLSNLDPDLTTAPLCVNGGVYSVVISDGTQIAENGQIVPAGGLIVYCSYPGHGKYAPSMDSQ